MTLKSLDIWGSFTESDLELHIVVDHGAPYTFFIGIMDFLDCFLWGSFGLTNDHAKRTKVPPCITTLCK